MHPNLKKARNSLVLQMLLIGPYKALSCYNHYLKDVSIFLAFLLNSVVYCDYSKSLPGGLTNLVLFCN